jgi:flavin reductase (DIM6/NTAB) family NADH-FMN oxidoreductase RutF
MGHYPTGVVVVTGLVDGAPVGMVVGTFSAVSMDPPLVSFMPMKSSRTYSRLVEASSFCVNVLAYDQVDACGTLAGGAPDKFDQVDWTVSAHGAPVIDGAVAYVHCRLHQQVDAGDHWIALCAVDGMEVARPVIPLLFFQGGYGAFSPKGMTARGDTDLITALRLADPARGHVEALAERLRCEVSALVAINEGELTTAVSAWGGSAEPIERLGHRIPLAPPIGDGVAISMVGPGARADFVRQRELLAEYAAGPLTPAREREIRSVLAQTCRFFADVAVEDDETYEVGMIVAPVRNPEGDVSMVVRMGQLAPGTSGAAVKSWVGALEQTVEAIEQELRRGKGQDRLQDYRAWYAYAADLPD